MRLKFTFNDYVFQIVFMNVLNRDWIDDLMELDEFNWLAKTDVFGRGDRSLMYEFIEHVQPEDLHQILEHPKFEKRYLNSCKVPYFTFRRTFGFSCHGTIHHFKPTFFKTTKFMINLQ